MTTAHASRHPAGFVLRCVLVLATVIVSFLCTGGPASAQVRSGPAAPQPAGAPPLVEAETDDAAVRQAAPAADDTRETVDAAPSDAGRCGKPATAETASTRDDHRPGTPLTAPARADRAAPTAPRNAIAQARDGGPAPPRLARLCVLRI